MVEHVRLFVEAILAKEGKKKGLIRQDIKQLYAELERIDVKDFELPAGPIFLTVRGELGRIASTVESMGSVCQSLEQLHAILPLYKGEGSSGKIREFPFIADPKLRDIIERDYADLKLRLFPANAWKSTVIMAGSILEAMLFDRLIDLKWNAKAGASPKARYKGGPKRGTPVPPDKWTLELLIEIAVDIGLLTASRSCTIDQVLRDYRNFVHPKKEVRSAHECGEAEGMLAMGALEGVCNHLAAHS